MGYVINSDAPGTDALSVETGGNGLADFLRHIGEEVTPEGALPAADIVVVIDATGPVVGDETTRQRVAGVYALAVYAKEIDRNALIFWG